MTSNAFNINVGSATKLVMTTQPTNAAAGASITPAVVVQVQDAGGNLVTTASNSVTMALTTNPGGSTLSGTTPVNAVGGVATFSDLSLNKVSSGYRITASATGLASAQSNTFNITAGAPAQLVFTTSPVATNPGIAFSTQPVVVIRDAFGNATTDTSSVTLTVTPGTGTAGTTIGCTANPVAAVSGTATFAGCLVDKVGTNYTLTATDGTLTAATSGQFSTTASTSWNMTPLALNVRQNKSFTQQFTLTNGATGSTRSCITIPTSGLSGITGAVITQPHSGTNWAFAINGTTAEFWRNSGTVADNVQTSQTITFSITATAGSPAGTILWARPARGTT